MTCHDHLKDLQATKSNMVQLAAAILVSYNEFGSVEKVFFMADSARYFY